MNARTLRVLATLGFTLLLALVSAPIAAGQSDIAALKARHKALDDELKRELQRLREYLNLVDQTLSAQSLLGQITPQQAGEHLQRTAGAVYQQSYTDAALWELRQQHFAATDGFVRFVQGQLATARWPAGRSAQDHRQTAEKEITELWTQYPRQQLMTVNLAPRLARIAELFAATRGEASLPNERNPFAQSGQRVTAVLSDLHGRHVKALRVPRPTGSRPVSAGSGGVGEPPSPPTGGTETHDGATRGTIWAELTRGDGRAPVSDIPPRDSRVGAGAAATDFAQTIQPAVTAAQAGRYADALPLFEQAARANPNSDTVLSGLGLCQNMLGDIDGALRTFDALHRVAPQSAGVRAWMAELLLAKGDHDTARRWLEHELKENPGSAWAFSWLGSIYWGLGQEQPARQAFARAMALDPTIANRRFENGTRLAAAQPARATVDFTAALMLNPSGTGVYYYLGECYYQLGQREPAAQSYRLFLQADSTSEWAARARQRLHALGQ